jgi:hypothetical protein
MSEEEEKALITLLIKELNSLYPVNLDTDIVCDRFMGDDVFEDKAMDRTDLVLIGASHLSNIGKHLNPDLWKVTDLTIPGWRISDDNVASMRSSGGSLRSSGGSLRSSGGSLRSSGGS